ncbi:MAG: SIS domain-containing protein [Patescibacteria group bacterium]
MSDVYLSAKLQFADYARRLQSVLQSSDWTGVERLVEELANCWRDGRQVFLCGNGGSAGNAIHLANDFLYGISKTIGSGLRVSALPANSAVLTCLANDVDYESIFSAQLAVQGRRGDVLIALSGSGNSPNIVKGLAQANAMGMKTYAILGYTGGEAKALASVPIHFPVDDMQISEDMQLIVGHMIMQRLCSHPPAKV